MRILLSFLLSQLFIMSNWSQEISESSNYPKIDIQTILEDSISIRAITIKDQTLYYAGTQGKYGYMDFEVQDDLHITNKKQFTVKNGIPNFRAIAATDTHFFLLSIESPALLYKIEKKTEEVTLVYREDGKNVFYDAINFWNNQEGIAMGDPTSSCLSVLITRDGGNHWKKIPCAELPETADGEAAFAASNGNISVFEENVWIVSGGIQSRVFHSSNKGKNWQVYETSIVQGKPTTGAYAIDFYDDKHGIIVGGDYKNPKQNQNNKALTNDGGKTWTLVGVGKEPGYKSCVQYVPNTNGNEIAAVGFTGISFSTDKGLTWKKLNIEAFYTLRFIDEKTAIAAGKNKIAIIKFTKSK